MGRDDRKVTFSVMSLKTFRLRVAPDGREQTQLASRQMVAMLNDILVAGVSCADELHQVACERLVEPSGLKRVHENNGNAEGGTPIHLEKL